MKLFESLSPGSSVLKRIEKYKIGSSFSTNDVTRGIRINPPSALQWIRQMECVTALNPDLVNNGSNHKEWVRNAKPDKEGICADCKLNKPVYLTKRDQVCPILYPNGRPKPENETNSTKTERAAFTDLELSIIRLIAQGVTNSLLIGIQVKKGPLAVRRSINHMYSKINKRHNLNISNRIELLRFMENEGFVELE